jgi:putative ABC transport system ATP-binding protein
MIRVESLAKSFPAPGGGAVHALAGVSVTIDEGEFVAIVGPSGSGKSTLLFALGGLAAPSEGAVWLAGRNLYDLGQEARAALRRSEIGFVFQTFNLVPYLTCEENVVLPALLAGRPRTEAREAARAVLDRLGLDARRGHRPAQLSVGERQRVGIGRALVNGPKVLLADEPTGNLDPATADDVMALLGELNAGGQTIAMVTHDLRLAAQAGRIVRLRAGRLDETPWGVAAAPAARAVAS